MQGFNNTCELVQTILTNNPKSRNSDNYLFYVVCKILLGRQGIDIDSLGFTKLFLSLKQYNLPQFETVGRIRRKLQSQYPELFSCAEVALERGLNSDSFRDYAKEGE